MKTREFEHRQQILNDIVTAWMEGKHDRAFDKLCWFCNGLLASIKDLESSISQEQKSTSVCVEPKTLRLTAKVKYK
jgi:hypothetical protein